MLYDISPIVSRETAVFPGDTKFSQDFKLSFEQQQHIDLSTIHTTTHIGAHTDAPRHYSAQGMDMASRELDFYLGPAQVLSVQLEQEHLITPDHLSQKIMAPRVLFKTLSFPNPNQWTNHFNALAEELVVYLAGLGVRLIGIDTPSIDPAQSKDLRAHKAIFEHDMAILEGIVLEEVPDGIYELIALPLRIKNGDASPVRAVLRS